MSTTRLNAHHGLPYVGTLYPGRSRREQIAAVTSRRRPDLSSLRDGCASSQFYLAKIMATAPGYP
mgnify:CR=1 FL=1